MADRQVIGPEGKQTGLGALELRSQPLLGWCWHGGARRPASGAPSSGWGSQFTGSILSGETL